MDRKKLCALLLAGVMTANIPMTALAGSPGSGAEQTSADLPDNAVVLESPDPQDDLSMAIWLENGTPYYKVTLNGYDLVQPSKLGMNTREIGSFESGFSMGDVQVQDVENQPWHPVVGDQEQVEDQYQEAIIPLTNDNGTLVIEARVYDTGVAFRYDLPDIPDGMDQYVIGSGDEATQFAFPEGAYAYRHLGQNQTQPSKTSVDNLGSNIFRPMTVTYPNGYAMTICEGNLDNYSILKLEQDSSNPRTAKVRLGGDVTVRAQETYLESKHLTAPAGPEVSPWRAMVVGTSLTDLAANATLTQLLNEAADEDTYQFSQWVEGGSCQRVMRGDNDDTNVMNNDYIEDMVDAAAARGYRYVLLDTGWQGPENDPNCDPRLDPSKLEPDKYESDKILQEQYFARPEEYDQTFLGNGEGCFYTRGQGFEKYGSLGDGGNMQVDIDIPAICDYANQRGVGIILYVNGTRFFPDDMSGNGGRYRFTPDELFEYFERWGVAGVKPGFVHCDSQNDELYMQEVVEAAARHHLVLTVHDKWVPSGIERTYPNLLSAEGIYGDEEKANVGISGDISTIFTRTIQGPADHTFCWPGKATKGYALASPLMFRTGLNLLFWYTNTLDIPDKDKEVIDFYDNLPATWKTTLYLEGSMGEYATIARQSFPSTANDGTSLPSRWYIGSLSAIDRTLTIPLDFLEEGEYVAEIYFDGPDADPDAGFNSQAKKEQTLLKETYLVDRSTTLVYNIQAKYGYSVRLTRVEDYGDVSGLLRYDRYALEHMLQAVNGLETPYYETAAWLALQQAATQAQTVLDNEAATAEDLKQALEALTAAYDAYLPTQPLLNAIASVKHLVPGYYTKESWAALEEQVEAGLALLDNPQASQEKLTAAVSAITAAMDALEEDLMATKELAAYVSDLDYDPAKSWNGDTYDPSTGEGNKMDKVQKDLNRSGTPLQLVVDGQTQTFEKGMGMDAPGELYYDLTDRGYEFLEATVGIDATKVGLSNGIKFQVYGDGELLEEVSITGDKAPQQISVPIAGIQELVLATDPNGSSSHDWANWVNARFMTVKSSDGNYEYVNAALGKPVEVTSIEKPENDKVHINDGDLATRWAASSSQYPQEAVIDLGAEYRVLQTVTNFYHKSGDRFYTYNLYTSTDGETWTLRADRSGNTTPGLNKDRMPQDTTARYVKLEVTGSSNPSAYASVFEFEVMVPQEVPDQADKTLLEQTVAYAETLSTDGVTDAAKQAFETALTNAKAVLADDRATQEEVNAAWDALLEGIWGLGLTQGDKTLLGQLIAKAEDMVANANKYVQDHWQELVDSLDTAKDVMADGNAMEEDVQPAAQALLDAILAQRFQADKSILEDLISRAEGMDLSGYTAESVDTLRSALAVAQAMLADASLSEDDQKTVDAAVEKLTAAMDGLTAGGAPEATHTPAATDKPQATETPETVPQTGDHSRIVLWGTLLSLCALGVLVLTAARGRRNV